MKQLPKIPGVFEIGELSMLVGLFSVTATFATNDYTKILRIVLALALLATACFIYVALSQKGLWRWLALISLLPVVYIVSDVFWRGGL